MSKFRVFESNKLLVRHHRETHVYININRREFMRFLHSALVRAGESEPRMEILRSGLAGAWETFQTLCPRTMYFKVKHSYNHLFFLFSCMPSAPPRSMVHHYFLCRLDCVYAKNIHFSDKNQCFHFSAKFLFGEFRT